MSISAVAANRRFGIFPKGASRYSWAALINTWITWALNAMVFSLIYALGTVIIDDFDLSPMSWGYVIIIYLAIRVLCDFPISMLSDRLGRGWQRKYVWCAVMMEYVIVGSLIAVPSLSGSLVGFVLLLLGVAIGTTASEAMGVIASVEWWPKEERGFAVGLHHTGYPLGALLAGWFASWVLHVAGPENWRLAYLASLLTLPFILWYWLIATPDHFADVEANTRRRGLTWAFAQGGGKLSFREALRGLRQREVLIAAVCVFLFQGMYNVFATTYPAYLKFVGGYSYAQVASLSVVWAITGALFQFLLPSLSDRWGRKWFIVGAGVTQAVVFLLMPSFTSVLGVVLVQLLYGVTLNAVFPLLFATAADVSGERYGTVLGAIFTSMWLGAVVGTWLATFVLQEGGGFSSAGAYRVLYGILVVVALGIAALRMLGRETVNLHIDAPEPIDTEPATTPPVRPDHLVSEK